MIQIFRKLLFEWLFSVIGFKSSAGNRKDLLKILKFKIGEQYDEYEFNLQSKGEVKQNSVIYDIYQYEKDDLTQIFNPHYKRCFPFI